MISDTANRDALLRLIDLQGKLSDLANEYADLGVYVVVNAMISKAHEALAITHHIRLNTAPSQEPQDARREWYARIIDPAAWRARENRLRDAQSWRERVGPDHSQQTCDFMATQRMAEGEALIRDCLAKADLILLNEGAGS